MILGIPLSIYWYSSLKGAVTISRDNNEETTMGCSGNCNKDYNPKEVMCFLYILMFLQSSN